MNKLLQNFDIDKTIVKHTKPIKKKSIINDHIADVIPPYEDYNFQADHLNLPTTKAGYKYLLTVCDLATKECDFEPVKSQSADETLRAFKSIIKRPYLNKPYASLRTDAGTAFKNNFAKWLYNESILHSVSGTARHKQTGSIEALNRQISMVLNAYMNSKERKTGRVFREWTEIIPKLRAELNKVRKKPLRLIDDIKLATDRDPRFKVGDMVYYKLDRPQDARGYFIDNSNTFRVGDVRLSLIPKKITQVLLYPNNIRYLLEGSKNIAYTEDELRIAEVQEDVAEVKKIIDDKKIKGKKWYRVWFLGDLKKNAVWLPEDQLQEDGLQDYIDFYLKDR